MRSGWVQMSHRNCVRAKLRSLSGQALWQGHCLNALWLKQIYQTYRDRRSGWTTVEVRLRRGAAASDSIPAHKAAGRLLLYLLNESMD